MYPAEGAVQKGFPQEEGLGSDEHQGVGARAPL